MSKANFGYRNSPYIWMDPRSKFVLFIAANVALWSRSNEVVSGLFFGFILVLLLNAKQWHVALSMGIIYYSFLMIDFILVPGMQGISSLIVLTIVRVSRLYMPLVCATILLIRTTTVSEFVAAFTKIGVSEKIIIPFSVMFRFFPTMGEEWRNIRNAMKFRGIDFGWKAVVCTPLKTLEYILVPLLMSTVKISGELSAASVSRGLGGTSKRTCYKVIRCRLLDYCTIIVAVVFIGTTLMNRV